jgi:hypothetical protein
MIYEDQLQPLISVNNAVKTMLRVAPRMNVTAAMELRATGKKPRRRAAWVIKKRTMPSNAYGNT